MCVCLSVDALPVPVMCKAIFVSLVFGHELRIVDLVCNTPGQDSLEAMIRNLSCVA